jgi:hypothetical protein
MKAGHTVRFVRNLKAGLPVPRLSPVVESSGLVDETLDFGDLWFPIGRAFTWSGEENLDTNTPAPLHWPTVGSPGVQVPVAKHWERISPTLSILTESIRYQDIAPQLAGLPETAQATRGSEDGKLLTVAPGPPSTNAVKKAFTLVSQASNPPRVILDYVTVVGGESYTFTNGTTYYLSNGCTFSSITFEAGAVLRFDRYGYLVSYSNIVCPVSGKVILSSADDNQYGEAFGNGNPTNYDQGLLAYEITNAAIRNLQVRWAAAGVSFLYAPNAALSNSSFFECDVAVRAGSSSSVTLTDDTQCVVTTPTEASSDSTITGTLTPDCGVASVAMVNDPERDLSGYDTNKNSQTECSFVVIDSTNVVAAFMNTHLSEYNLAGAGQYFPGIPSPRMTSWSVSTNGGTNFVDQGPILPLSTIINGSSVITNGASDPMHGDDGDTTMAYDSVNGVVSLLVNSSREETNWYGFRLWSSTDKGRTFDAINMDVPGTNNAGGHLVRLSDKPMIKVNSTNLYVAGRGTVSNSAGIWAARSTDRGTNWNLFKLIDVQPAGGSLMGVDICVIPDGTVYVFWLRTWGTTNQFRYAWLSANGLWSSPGNFGPHLNCTSTGGDGSPLRFNGTDSNDHFVDNSYPRVAYANGNIYLAYCDLPTPGSPTDRGDIFLLEAPVIPANRSLIVTAGPRRVNNDSTLTDQWNPSITANPSGTELFIGYYSRQNDPVTNSWITPYGAKAFITNGLTAATFDCFPISPTNFLPVFAGTNAANDTWAFDPVWPQHCVCLDTNAAYAGGSACFVLDCPPSAYVSTLDTYSHFCADDYTWSCSDADYFYFAWCDRSRVVGTVPHTRSDADIQFAKIRH